LNNILLPSHYFCATRVPPEQFFSVFKICKNLLSY
jgi:hypothetical protein